MFGLRANGVSDLILVGHHCICDGQSGINLLRELLSAYDQPDQDLGAYDALGAIEDIVPAALLENPRFQRRVRWKAGVLRLILFLKQRGGNAFGPRIAPEQIYFHRWNSGNEAALELTERCRSEGVTVLAAVSVAFMQAFRDVRGARGLSKTCTMVNTRRFLPKMRADAMFGLAPGVPLPTKALPPPPAISPCTSWVLPKMGADAMFGLAPGVALRTKGLPPPRDMSACSFWVRAREVKADLSRRIDRLGAGMYDNLAGLERLHDKYASLVAYFESAPAVRNVTLSNMGRLNLPQQYRSFRLERVYSPLVMVSPTPANTVVISSFAGKMEFAIISDNHSLPYAQALEIRQRAMEILRTCVALPAQYKSAPGNEPSAMRAETA